MIFGSYPCCGGHLALPMPNTTPAWASENCPHCGELVWHRYSRLQSMSWTEPDFLAEHDVDPIARTIKPKPGTAAYDFEKFGV